MEESHGGGGPFSLLDTTQDPPESNKALDEELNNLMIVLSAHNLLGFGESRPPRCNVGDAEARPSSMGLDF